MYSSNSILSSNLFLSLSLISLNPSTFSLSIIPFTLYLYLAHQTSLLSLKSHYFICFLLLLCHLSLSLSLYESSFSKPQDPSHSKFQSFIHNIAALSFTFSWSFFRFHCRYSSALVGLIFMNIFYYNANFPRPSLCQFPSSIKHKTFRHVILHTHLHIHLLLLLLLRNLDTS